MISSAFKGLAATVSASLICMAAIAQTGTGAKELFWGPDGPILVQLGDRNPDNPSGLGDRSGTKPPKGVRRGSTNAGLQVWVNLVDSMGNARRVSPASYVFRSGDKIEIEFKTNTAGYLYVVNLGTSGVTRPLFPHSANQDNFVDAWTDARLPQRIVFDSTPGVEQIAVVLSRVPRRDVAIQHADGSLVTVALDRQSRSAAGDPTPSSPEGVGQNAAQPTPGGVLGADRGDGAQGLAIRTPERGDTMSVALADLGGAKDLFVDDDGQVLTVVRKVRGSLNESESARGRQPLVVSLKLRHE
jgi:hypothetical protein